MMASSMAVDQTSRETKISRLVLFNLRIMILELVFAFQTLYSKYCNARILLDFVLLFTIGRVRCLLISRFPACSQYSPSLYRRELFRKVGGLWQLLHWFWQSKNGRLIVQLERRYFPREVSFFDVK